MSIPVEHEDTAALKAWGLGLEKLAESCCFCRTPTRTWFAKHTPVCAPCAELRDESEIPTAREDSLAA